MSPLVPVAVGAFIALFVVALVREARRQRSARAALFRDFAAHRGLAFRERDDEGTARRLAAGLAGIAVFHSPSLGERVPRNVVRGSRPEGELCLFQHGVRVTEGDARLYTVCVLRSARALGGPLRLAFPRGGRAPETRARLGRPVALPGVDPKELVSETPEPEAVPAGLDAEAARALIEAEAALPFRAELQVQGGRVAAYLAERNAEPAAEEELAQLLDFAALAARRLAGPPHEA